MNQEQPDPDQYTEAGKQLAKLSTEIGLDLIQFGIIPDLDGSERVHVQCIFVVNPERIGKSAEERKMVEEQEKFRLEMETFEHDQKMEAKLEEYVQWLESRKKEMDAGNGFL